MKDFPYTELQRAWLEDLKTTDAPQTDGVLHRIEDTTFSNAGYCCLGRACVVAGLPERIRGHQDKTGEFSGENAILPEELWKKLKLRSGSGTFKHRVLSGNKCGLDLAGLNDALGWTFKQIAEYIEANPENVFTNLEEDNAG